MLPVVGERKRCEAMEEERETESRTKQPQKHLPLDAEHHGHVFKHNKNDFLLMFDQFYLIGKGIWHVNG
jgi:hypothetical protein